jgi:hypothetical protein
LGVGIFWPVSAAHLDLALPWFRTLPRWASDWATLRILLVEAVFYGAILGVAIVGRAVEVRLRGRGVRER